MANLPKLPTMNGLFTWIKTKFLKIGNTDIELIEGDNYVIIKTLTNASGSSYKKGIYLLSGNDGLLVYDAYGGTVIYGTNYFRPYPDDSGSLGLSSYRWHEAHIGMGGIYSDGKITVNSAIVFNLPRQSSPPADPATDDIYFDDGTNTADGKPHLRAWNGSAWEDL